MKTKFYFLVVGIFVGAVMGVPAGMNLERGAPLLSNPFSQRPDRESLSEQLRQEAGKAVSATKEGARKALDETKRKVHEATKPDDQN